MKASQKLAGQDDLADRKGSWKYEGGGDDAAAGSGAGQSDGAGAGSASGSSSASGGAAKDAAASAAQGASGASSGGGSASAMDGGAQDYDKDGVNEGTDEGSKPQMLDAAREGGPDNLKEVKGIGPKLEQLCHSLGVYHFDQIASWGAAEVAWMDANLKGFRGRVSRDDWVGQAKILAAGGETEFSERVDKGQVY